MNYIKQHLIDPEICIRCHTCEEACPIGAITHNDDNVVVDAAKCDHCMTCISPCPTGSIDNWRVVAEPYGVDQQLGWVELPAQEDVVGGVPDGGASTKALDAGIEALLAEAHKGAGGQVCAPASASKPTINLHNSGAPLTAVLQGNFRLTDDRADSDVRHIILDLGAAAFPFLEGQTIGITPPGMDTNGKPHVPRLYSISSPRDGERPNTNNLSLTIKREEHGLCSNHICDLAKGDTVKVTGPYGESFLHPEDPGAKLLMVCTGTGSAPFRAFTMRRQRAMPDAENAMTLFFGARTPESLPYFGPLNKIPESFLAKHFAFSRVDGEKKVYVQDKLRDARAAVATLLGDPATHIYICGLKAMEEGVEKAFCDIARGARLQWTDIRSRMRDAGRYHVETY